MAGRVLHIFNPEHDYALAVGRGPYTPPSSVIKLANHLALLPSVYASENDLILVPDTFIQKDREDPFLDVARRKKISIIKASEIPGIMEDICRIKPWGWNHHLKSYLQTLGISEDILPGSNKLDKIREFSHRRMAIFFRQQYAKETNDWNSEFGRELFSIEDVKDFMRKYPYSYFKTPWSSSGRGVISSTHITEKGLLEWTWGSIKRQGSVIGEPGWNRALDFATEWFSEGGKINFAGLSVFHTSERGKYLGNYQASQNELFNIIKSNAPSFDTHFIEVQKKILTEIIIPDYEGPIGIDMLVDIEGRINPCVEINLRMTMGHIALYNESGLKNSDFFKNYHFLQN